MAEIRTYPPGVTVLRQGTSAGGVYNVRSGALRLLHLAPSGRTVAVGLVANGGLVGLPEVITGSAYPFTAETVERSTLEYAPRREFVPFLLNHPQVAVEVLIWFGQEFQQLQWSLCEMATRPELRTRLLKQMRQLGETCGCSTADGIELDPLVTGQALADILGCSRQWVSKLLGDFEHQGLIKRRARRITVTPAALLAAGGEAGLG
jgi:CRP-like cAMP-binding protein